MEGCCGEANLLPATKRWFTTESVRHSYQNRGLEGGKDGYGKSQIRKHCPWVRETTIKNFVFENVSTSWNAKVRDDEKKKEKGSEKNRKISVKTRVRDPIRWGRS